MKKQGLAWSGILIFAALVLCFSSCVNEEYDVADLDTEVTLAGESLTLPLGSTKQLKLKSLMSGMSDDMLQVLDGGYALRINDRLDLSEQLPDMKNMLVVPDVVFEKSTIYNINSFGEDSKSIGAQHFTYSFDLIKEDINVSFDPPKVQQNSSNPTGIWEKGKAAREMEIKLNDVTLTTKPLFKVPDVPAGTIVPSFPETEIEPEATEVVVTSKAPEGISNISDIMMSDNAVMEIKLSADNSFLASGDVIPDMVLDLGGLAVLENGLGQVELDRSCVLNAENGYTLTKKYHVVELNVNESDWDTSGELKLKKQIRMTGSASIRNAVVDASKLSGYTAAGMGLHVEIAFKDMNIKSIMMDVEMDPVVEKMTIPVTIEEFELPDGVTRINKVAFTEESLLDLSINVKNLDIKGLDMTLESLQMAFPSSMVVEEAVGGVWKVSEEGLDREFRRQLHVTEFYLPDPVDGKISYDAEVELEAVMTLGGRICSADVPYTEDKDGAFMVNAVSDFKMDDYYAQIDNLTHDLNLEPQDFTYVLPSDISNVGTFTIYPEGTPMMIVDFNFPETNPEIDIEKDGLVIELPKFLKFKPTQYDLDQETNTLYVRGDIPEQIQLPIEKLVVTPVKDTETGDNVAKGQIIISGGFAVEPGEACGKDISALSKADASIVANIDEIVTSEISFDKFQLDSSEEFEFTLLQANDLPEQVKSVSDVVLDDVFVQIDITVDDMPDFGVAPIVDFQLELPEALVLDETDDRVDGNRVSVVGEINDGKVAVEPIALKAMDLGGFDLGSGKDIAAKMRVDGYITVLNPEVSLEEMSGDVKMNIRAAIEDIAIEEINAMVDYKIDGINESFKLEGLPEFMKGDDFVIDLADPHLVIKAKTNMGIPVAGNLSIVPVIGGVENAEARIDAPINLPYTESAQKSDSLVLWFGADKESCPADYTFVEADINKLIRRIPDELMITMAAATDSDKECVLDPSADYDLDLEYDFVVPMAFGKDLHIEICDTVYVATPLLAQALQNNKVQLAGSVTSSLPVQLELNIELLDDSYMPVPMSEQAKQKISAGNSDGTAVVSPLELTLAIDKNASVSGLAGLKMTFVVTAPNASGRPVGENDFVQADLKVALPEGITIDVEGLM